MMSPSSPHSSLEKYIFFILTKPVQVKSKRVDKGTICYMTEEKYISDVSGVEGPQTLTVKVISGYCTLQVRVDSLYQLTEKQAGFLKEVEVLDERLGFFLERTALESAQTICMDQEVKVLNNSRWGNAIVRYIGAIASDPVLPGIVFGVELKVNV
nr:PREDICTED: uncharacterized protein LOC106706233 [Latimeria chalumnae]|eukprot:XP_014352321.1 PREDICTED: uncharacterized protein LOC106706233 [Latimeria chalumnae]